MGDTLTKTDWEFDTECPRCGEDTDIGSIIQERNEDGEPIKAEMVCGASINGLAGPTDIDGCGNTWEWTAE